MYMSQKKPTLFLLTTVIVAMIGCTSQTSERLAERRAEQPQRQTPQPTSITAPVATLQDENKLEVDQINPSTAGLTAKESHVWMGADLAAVRMASESLDRENYAHYQHNPIQLAAEQPVSTFSIDVDTGSYSNVRRMLREGRLPIQDAVRIEELVNYFSYDYPRPTSTDQPFRVSTEMAVTPWNDKTHLLQIGVQGYEVAANDLPASNLVFLIDVSGSMESPDKLGLLKSSLILLSKRLRPEDRVSIVVYAGASGVVLEPTSGNDNFKIEQALAALSAGGSTNGAAGIRLAYDLAERAFIKGGINRVMLATDGDFNVGTTDFEALIDLVEEKRKSGIALTTLGFGSGNYNDQLMEQLANAGNGNYAYIDTLLEAQKVLVDQVGATLQTIAKDVKIQIEFNPALVAEYRLIGYENRVLQREDFNNDQVDAGEIGAGHNVTALYEIALVGSAGTRIDPLRYGSKPNAVTTDKTELALLRLRYKAPNGDTSKLIESPIHKRIINTRLAETSERFRFAAAVAGFGQQLRGDLYLENFSYPQILEIARTARGKDQFGYRGEFIQLVGLAASLSHATPQQAQLGDD